MTEFLDGPAAGQCLMLRRAPLYLRAAVTRGDPPTWHALEQAAAEPRPGEDLVAYRRVGPLAAAKLWGGYFALAKYRAIDPPPDAATLRDNATWQAWCLARVAAIREQLAARGQAHAVRVGHAEGCDLLAGRGLYCTCDPVVAGGVEQ